MRYTIALSRAFCEGDDPSFRHRGLHFVDDPFRFRDVHALEIQQSILVIYFTQLLQNQQYNRINHLTSIFYSNTWDDQIICPNHWKFINAHFCFDLVVCFHCNVHAKKRSKAKTIGLFIHHSHVSLFLKCCNPYYILIVLFPFSYIKLMESFKSDHDSITRIWVCMPYLIFLNYFIFNI